MDTSVVTSASGRTAYYAAARRSGMDERLADLADAVRAADVAVAFTGAGVSTASGVPSFRGEDGIWRTQFDPADFRRTRFDRDPAGFWRDRLDLHDAMFDGSVAPNPAHDALAELEREGFLAGVITQNTDGLHAAAGSEQVVELHGNAHRVACQSCGSRYDAAPVRERVRDGELPPTCDCGGVLKPDVVLFGEALDADTVAEAERLARDADVFVVAGSSLTVEPAASLPATAARDGLLAVVNLEATERDDRADLIFRDDVTEVLPQLADRVLGRNSD